MPIASRSLTINKDLPLPAVVGRRVVVKSEKNRLTTLRHRLMDAREHERAWIARELHDDIGQRVVGLTMLLRGLLRNSSSALDTMRDALDDVCGQFEHVGADIQAMSRRLHPSRVELLGLPASVDSLCRELSGQGGVTIDVDHAGIPDDLARDVALGLFRVLQEALANAIKHSGARHVAVMLRAGRRDIQLQVADRGAGFDPDTAMKGRGFGLTSMQERVSLLDGELSIASRPGFGTTIRVRVPLRQA